VSPQGLVMFSAKFFFASPDGNDTGETGKRFRHSVPVPVSLLPTLMLVRTVNLTFPSCTRNNYDHNRQPRRQQVHSSAFIVPRRRRGFNWWALRRNQMVPRRFLRPPCRGFFSTPPISGVLESFIKRSALFFVLLQKQFILSPTIVINVLNSSRNTMVLLRGSIEKSPTR
jgi:hypothetical protein